MVTLQSKQILLHIASSQQGLTCDWHTAGAEAAGVSTDASAHRGSQAGAHPALLPPAPALHPGSAGPGQSSGPVHPPLPPPPGDASGGVTLPPPLTTHASLSCMLVCFGAPQHLGGIWLCSGHANCLHCYIIITDELSPGVMR